MTDRHDQSQSLACGSAVRLTDHVSKAILVELHDATVYGSQVRVAFLAGLEGNGHADPAAMLQAFAALQGSNCDSV